MSEQPEGQRRDDEGAERTTSVVDLGIYRQSVDPLPITFHRRELDAILWIYG
ncbi:MAG: DUF2794 domain-containing protein, partial [Rhizobium rosettiformans]